MSAPVVACVVEGHGEVRALPLLISRVALQLWNMPYIETPTPYRLPLGRMLQSTDLGRVVQLQRSRVEGRPGGVLVVADTDDQCPLERRDRLLANVVDPGVEVVLAVAEYESWLLAGDGDENAEVHRDAKRRLGQRLGLRYSPTIHQARLTAALDVHTAIENSRSFRRLVSALGALVGAQA